MGIRGVVDLAVGSCGGVTRSNSTSRSRDSGGRTCLGLKSAQLHAPGQAGHGTCQERFLLLLVHMCCWHSLSLQNLTRGSAAQTNLAASASTTQEAAHLVSGSRELPDLGFRVGAA